MKTRPKLDDAEIRRLVNTDEDFVNMPRYNNSVAAVVEAHPNGLPMRVVARAMAMTENEAEEVFQSALRKMRDRLGVDELDSDPS